MNLPALTAAVLLVAVAGACAARTLAPEARGPALCARALVLGPWVLALEALGYGIVGVPLSLPALAAPWLPAGFWLLGPARGRTRPRAAPLPWPWLLAAVPVGLTALRTLAAPFPEGDHLYNFAVQAKIFQASGRLDFEALHSLPFPGHREYPPLIPLAEVPFLDADPLHGWRLLGAFAPAALAALLLLAAEVLEPLRRGTLARFLIVAGTPILYQVAGRHPADLFVAAAGLLVLHEAHRLHAGGARAALCCAAAGSAAWLAKDEGAAFAAVAGLALVAGTRGRQRILALLVLGAPSLLWLFLRQAHGLNAPLVPVLSARALARFGEALGRLAAVFLQVTPLAWIPLETPLRLWIPAYGVLLAAGLLVCGAGLGSGQSRRRSSLLLLGLSGHLSLLAAGAALRGEDLAWLQATAFDRLVLQVLPWGVSMLALPAGRGSESAAGARPAAGS